MQIDKADEYYLKAQNIILCENTDNLESGLEALNYALSSNPQHCGAMCLLGYAYANLMMEYDKAFRIFDKVIEIDPHYVQVYPIYAEYLIRSEEYNRAEVLINFSKKMKRVNLAELYWCQFLIAEMKGKYKDALEYIRKAKKYCYEFSYFTFLNHEEERIMEKLDIDDVKKKVIKESKQVTNENTKKQNH